MRQPASHQLYYKDGHNGIQTRNQCGDSTPAFLIAYMTLMLVTGFEPAEI